MDRYSHVFDDVISNVAAEIEAAWASEPASPAVSAGGNGAPAFRERPAKEAV
jgi:hypothetical protein